MTDDMITIDERYTSATQARNLRVQADQAGQADLLIAAGWSMSTLGMALLRLHSQYDSAEHPKPGTAIYAHEAGLMLGKLKELPRVRAMLIDLVGRWKHPVESPHDLVADVLIWWLDSVCPVCHGAERDRASHAKAVCPACRGNGKRKLPRGENGRKLANLIDDCTNAARDSIKRRLRPQKVVAAAN